MLSEWPLSCAANRLTRVNRPPAAKLFQHLVVSFDVLPSHRIRIKSDKLNVERNLDFGFWIGRPSIQNRKSQIQNRSDFGLNFLNVARGVNDRDPVGPSSGFGEIAGAERGAEIVALALHAVERPM